MEFLTTYGWAFLVIVAVITGMSYFGVFDTGRFVSPSCSLDTNMACPVYSATYDFDNPSNGYVFNINFENFMTENVYVVDLLIQEKVGEEFCHAHLIDDVTSGGGPYCTPAQDLPMTPDYNGCGAFIPPNRNLDLKFTYDPSDCNFSASNLIDPNEDRKYSYNFKLYYLKGGSNKPLISGGTLIVPLTRP